MVEISGDLDRLKGQPILLTLVNWQFHDWRPRDESFYIEATIEGYAHRLNVFLFPHHRLDEQSRMLLFAIGSAADHPEIRIEGVVSWNSTLSAGLYIDIVSAGIEDAAE